MKSKLLAAGAAAALSLGLMAAPAQAYVFGFTDWTGATLLINGGADNSLNGGFNIQADFDGPNAAVGVYGSNGWHDPGIESNFLARPGDPDSPQNLGYNNYFVFSLADLVNVDTQIRTHVDSAALLLWTGAVTHPDFVRLGSYSGDPFSLEAGLGDGIATYNALAAGDAYAYAHFHVNQGQGPWRAITLNDTFLSDINDGRTQIVLGGTLQNPPGIPEPATWGMMIVGFFGLGALLRSRRQKAALAA